MDTMERILAFCRQNGLAYETEELNYNGVRVVVRTGDRYAHNAIMDAARRLDGINVSGWTCGPGGGMWADEIYLQDAEELTRIKAAIAEARKRQLEAV